MDEAALENLTMAWFDNLGYQTAHGKDIIHERGDTSEVILWKRFGDALERINPGVPGLLLNHAIRQFKRSLTEEADQIRCNRQFQNMLIEGIPIQQREGSSTKTVIVKLVDRYNVDANDWLVVNQVEVWNEGNQRFPDIVVYLNGLPISVFELKTFANEEVYLVNGFKQLQTYKKEIPQLFLTNEILVTSNGKFARFGSLTAGWDRFMPWRDMNDTKENYEDELETMLYDLFNREHLIEYIHDYILFLDPRSSPAKIIAGYHQSHAASSAFSRTLEEVEKDGRGKIGVVWHTQGSGKSLTMAFLTGLIVRDTERLQNPTVLVITDRKDLDGQLFGTFGAAREFLRQEPERIENKNDLIARLSGRRYGGIIFSTIQKFLPKVKGESMGVLSERSNIVVIADEAHRSQYDFLDGFAANLNIAFPNASFIGFTGTPISFEDRNTREVFGEDISIYDLKQSILDRSTVNIYLEKRRIPLVTTEESKLIDEAFEAATEGEEEAITERAKRRWTRLEAAFGAEKRLKAIIEHMIPHIEERRSPPAGMINGKVMIVCATRRICVKLHDMIREERPDWYSEKDNEGQIKVIMTGSASDSNSWGEHIRNATRRGQLANLFRDPESGFRVAIVCDMWLTGFDAPSLSTMYIDKPMKGHGLMQALARVNRAFKDKSGGYVVDYFGLQKKIAEAVEQYTASKGRGQVIIDADTAESLLKEKHEVVTSMFHSIDFSKYWDSEPLKMNELKKQMLERINTLQIRDIQASQRRFGQEMSNLNRAYNLAKTSDYARKVRGDVRLFQSLQGHINHRKPEELKDPELLDTAIQQILDQSVAPTGLSDILGITDTRSIFDADFVAHIQGIEQKNLAQAALEELLHGQIKNLKKRNAVRSKRFSEMLEATLQRYRDGDNEDVQRVIDELLDVLKSINEAEERGENMGLSEPEYAFFEALETDVESVRQLGDEVLCEIAKELTVAIRENTTIDWSLSKRKQANMRLLLRDILDNFGYPRSEQEEAVKVVLEQAKLASEVQTSGL